MLPFVRVPELLAPPTSAKRALNPFLQITCATSFVTRTGSGGCGHTLLEDGFRATPAPLPCLPPVIRTSCNPVIEPSFGWVVWATLLKTKRTIRRHLLIGSRMIVTLTSSQDTKWLWHYIRRRPYRYLMYHHKNLQHSKVTSHDR